MMSSLVPLAAFAAFLTVALPEQVGAADTNVSTVEEVQVETKAPEQPADAPVKSASPAVVPALGVALLLTLSTTLFLLLRCLQSRPSSQANENVRSLSANDGDGDEDPCKKLEEQLAGGDEGEEQQPAGDSGARGPFPDVEGKFVPLDIDDSNPLTADDLEGEGGFDSKQYPDPHPPRTLDAQEVEDAIGKMETVLRFIDEGEQSGSHTDSEGESTAHRLRDGFELRQEYKLAQCGPDVPPERAQKLQDLIAKIEEHLYRVYGTHRWRAIDTV